MSKVDTLRSDRKAAVTVAKGIVLRMTALGGACGFGLGMIYGLAYPMVASWLNEPGSFDGAVVLGLTLGILVGWVIGGVLGLIWGLVTGLCVGLALAVIVLYSRSGSRDAAGYPALFTVVSLILILAAHLILLFWRPPSYPTFPHWLLNAGLPVAIMAITFGIIAYHVGNWARSAADE